MSRGTGWSPALFADGICLYTLERPEGRPDLKCTLAEDHAGGHLLTPEYEAAEEPCPHYSFTGDEGPVSELGRWPRRWRCDGCGEIRYDDDPEPQGSENG